MLVTSSQNFVRLVVWKSVSSGLNRFCYIRGAGFIVIYTTPPTPPTYLLHRLHQWAPKVAYFDILLGLI